MQQKSSNPTSPAALSLAVSGLGRSSWLVTPGASPGRFATAADARADVALLDLEDSVPAPLKDEARTYVLRFLRRVGLAENRPSAFIGVRVNAPDTLDGLKDLTGLAEHGLWPALLLVPKVESARDVELVLRIMGDSTAPSEVWALIESPRAMQNLTGILHAPRLGGVVFGAADYAAEAGCKITSRAMWYPRAMLAAAAATVGLPAVDSPYFTLPDLDGLRREAEESAELGFVGKVAIHPAQLPVIQAAFRPSQGDLEAARAVISAAEAADGAITTVGGAMVGPPIVAAARALTARAGQVPALPLSKESDHE
ncbi:MULTISPECIES: HpcH/HpaI aldolase/citrate lyase family protein [Streptomyces]|uniref:CoA ester lyase n=1 Tax=Streptomyces kasugaensis TaxID=1946 RepID=A0A4Q9I0U6_STRKA|nr:aldolase/citrate lyase family protein [Streptomyces kasugaensis]TBO61294.1 CoA ester lyase [Streptomyces kasugaensis]